MGVRQVVGFVPMTAALLADAGPSITDHLTERFIEHVMPNAEFYIIWEPTSSRPPTRRFYSEEQAYDVAEKMAERHPGKKFFVLKAIGVVKPQTVIRVKFADGHEVDAATESNREEILPGGSVSYGPPTWETRQETPWHGSNSPISDYP